MIPPLSRRLRSLLAYQAFPAATILCFAARLATADLPLHTTRWALLQLIGFCSLAAFVSIGPQLPGLCGPAHGILPIDETMDKLREWQRWRLKKGHATPASAAAVNAMVLRCWTGATEARLTCVARIGSACACCLLAGGWLLGRAATAAPALQLVGALGSWCCWTCIRRGAGMFMSLQWDLLLSEVLLLTLPVCATAPRSRAAATLQLLPMQLLAFRHLLAQGACKLLAGGGDASWRSLGAMLHHHETQPLPSRAAPLLHAAGRAIPGAAAAQAVGALATEFVVAWLLLLPTAGGVANGAVLAQAALQAGIVCSGGFGFFNLLTVATCVACANDAAWWLLPLSSSPLASSPSAASPPPAPAPPLPFSRPPAWAEWADWAAWLPTTLGASTAPPPPPSPPPSPLLSPTSTAWAADDDSWANLPLLPPLSWDGAAAVAQLAALALVAAAVATLYGACVAKSLDVAPAWARATDALHAALSPLGLGASYGAFASVTTTRYELSLLGSADGVSWRELPCKWKPGDPEARLRVWSHPLLWLHCPRLDWRLWFAAIPAQPPAWVATYVALLGARGPPRSGGDDPDGAQAAALALLDEAAIRRRDPQLAELRHLRVRRYVYRFAPGAAWGGEPWAREDLGCVLESR